VPVYQIEKPNQTILLYEGPLEITHRATVVKGNGKLRFIWFPYPQVEFELSNDDPLFSPFFNDVPGETFLSLPELRDKTKVFVSGAYQGGNYLNRITGNPKEPIVTGSGQDLTYVLFHLTNFHNFIGPDKSMSLLQRIIFEAEGWKVTVDQLETTKTIVDLLKSQGGYAITHVGKLERSDKTTFTADEACEFLEALSFFLSFSRGFWVFPLLLVGYNRSDEATWQKWDSAKSSPWQNVQSWFLEPRTRKVAEAFPGFLRWWQDWGEPAELAIYWYVGSNTQAGGVEGSLVLEQTAFELLAWVLLVQERRILSAGGFSKLSASDKLRLLLSQLSIPLEVSPSLPNLAQLSKSRDWNDGPEATTWVRNGIVHPKPKMGQKALLSSSSVRVEAWNLGMWYLELILLKLFNYEGPYFNRLRQGFHFWGDGEPVPWVLDEQ
jgi:hypothetical protein